MAYQADSVWEIRTTGNVNNGAGYSIALGAGSTDYSQQDAAQLSVADAVTNGTTTITSVTGGFTAAMRGNVVFIYKPAVSTVGYYQIASVTNGNTLVVDTSVGLGSQTGLTLNVGGAGLISQNAFGFTPVAGNKIWMKAGTYLPTANLLQITANGTSTLPIVVEGYTTTRGDKAPTPPLVQYSGGAFGVFNLGGEFGIARYLSFDAATTTQTAVTLSGNRCELLGCKVVNGRGWLVGMTGNNGRLANCLVDGKGVNSSVDGMVVLGFGTTGHTVEFNTIAGASVAAGIADSGGMNTIQNNIIRNNAGNGLWLGGSGNGRTVRWNDVWNNGGDAVNLRLDPPGLEGLKIQYNILGRSGAYDLNHAPGDVSAQFGSQEWAKTGIDTNAFFTTGTGRYHNLPGGTGDVVLVANPFVDDTTLFDFRLNSTAGGGLACQGAAQNAFLDGVNTGIYSLGALGGGVVASVGGTAGGTAPTIAEVQFPTIISRGAEGGPTFSTLVVTTDSGAEQRLKRWATARWRYRISLDARDAAQMRDILAFYVNRAGRFEGFRFKDWGDYSVTGQALVPTGAATVQLVKTYTYGGATYTRNIYKPVAGTLTVTRGGGAFSAYTLDTTTGLLNLTPDVSANVSAISQAAAAAVTTTAAHGLSVGQTVAFAGVSGMTQINGLTGVIGTTPTSTTLTVGINSTAFSAYTSGGTVAKYLQPGESILASFQFDTPVRFNMDESAIVQEDVNVRSWQSIELLEVR